jgi:hypothetical protein
VGERERSPEEFHDTKLTGLELINSYLLAQGSGMPRSLDRSLANGPLAPSFLKKINPPRFCWQILPDYTSTGGRVFVLSNQVLSGEARAARGQMAPRACGPLVGNPGSRRATGCWGLLLVLVWEGPHDPEVYEGHNRWGVWQHGHQTQR